MEIKFEEKHVFVVMTEVEILTWYPFAYCVVHFVYCKLTFLVISGRQYSNNKITANMSPVTIKNDFVSQTLTKIVAKYFWLA